MSNFVIEIIPHKGDPTGLKTVNIIGRTLRAYIIPRVDLSDVREFEDIDKPALYFLLGEKEDDSALYVGQTDNLLRRLGQQKTKNEEWNVALAFVAGKEMNVAYLEKKVIEEVEKKDRYKLLNSTSSPGSQVTQAVKIVNDNFYDEIKFITTLLGYKIFIEKPTEYHAENIYFLKSKGVQARGTMLKTNEFVVFKSSQASIHEAPALKKHVKKSYRLRKIFQEKGILKLSNDENYFIFTQDQEFTSPSSAASVVRGTATNGWTAWVDHNGKTLDENIRQKF